MVSQCRSRGTGAGCDATPAKNVSVPGIRSLMAKSGCRFCGVGLSETFADLGVSPLANRFVPLEKRHEADVYFPLHAYVCTNCWLVQLEEFETPQAIFGDYIYFSSYSDSWLK